MDSSFSELTYTQRRAAFALVMIVISANNNGKISILDPDMEKVGAAFSDSDLPFSWLPMMQEAVALDPEECIAIVSGFDSVTKAALHFLMSGFVGDDIGSMLTFAEIARRCGLNAWKNAKAPAEDRVVIEGGDSRHDLKSVVGNPFVRVSDVSFVRELQGAVQHVIIKESGEERYLPVSLDAWEAMGRCPANGMAGIVCRKEATHEGELSIVAFSNELAIGVLEQGLEPLEEYQYISKAQNNRILAHDRYGERLAAFRRGEFEEPVASLKKRGTIVRFYAKQQERFEPGREWPVSYVDRTVVLEYQPLGREVTISVDGVARPTLARIVNDDGRVLTYEAVDLPGRRYEVETRPEDNTIQRVSIFNGPIEYRYSN